MESSEARGPDEHLQGENARPEDLRMSLEDSQRLLVEWRTLSCRVNENKSQQDRKEESWREWRGGERGQPRDGHRGLEALSAGGGGSGAPWTQKPGGKGWREEGHVTK